MPKKHQGRTALYRLYAKRRLLYIGISRNPDVRWGQHSITKEWWPEVSRRKVEWFDTRAEAEVAERKAIREEKPRWNDRHQDKTPRSRPVRVPTDRLELYAMYKRALTERRKLEPQIKEMAVDALRQGATTVQLARLTGMSPEVFRRIARDNDIPVAEKYQSRRTEAARARKAAAEKPAA